MSRCYATWPASALRAASPRSGIPQDPQALVLLGQVDGAARVDQDVLALRDELLRQRAVALHRVGRQEPADLARRSRVGDVDEDRKSTRLNSSHMSISYAVFC